MTHPAAGKPAMHGIMTDYTTPPPPTHTQTHKNHPHHPPTHITTTTTTQVYRANIDRLVERPVMFGDGGWVLVHAAMTNALHEVLTTCPYFMEWRFSFGVGPVDGGVRVGAGAGAQW